MGTPHRGAEIASLGVMLSNIINFVSLGQTVRNDLLRDLKANSTALEEISKHFIECSASLRIKSFYEMQIEPLLRSVVSFLWSLLY